MIAADLRQACEEIEARAPAAELIKNEVGNLTIVDDDVYVAWLDLRTAEVNWLDPAERERLNP